MIKCEKRVRPSMDETYLKVAEAFAKRSACIRRGYGAVIAKNNELITTGYNGGYRGGVNCCDIGSCEREELNIPPGERYELCRSVIHAEMNVCQNEKRSDLDGSTLYLYGWDFRKNAPVEDVKPCGLCDAMLRNANVKEIKVWKNGKIETISLHKNVFISGRHD